MHTKQCSIPLLPPRSTLPLTLSPIHSPEKNKTSHEESTKSGITIWDRTKPLHLCIETEQGILTDKYLLCFYFFLSTCERLINTCITFKNIWNLFKRKESFGSFYLIVYYFLILFICTDALFVFMSEDHVCFLYPKRPEGNIQCPGTRVTNGYDTSHGCWESNLGALNGWAIFPTPLFDILKGNCLSDFSCCYGKLCPKKFKAERFTLIYTLSNYILWLWGRHGGQMVTMHRQPGSREWSMMILSLLSFLFVKFGSWSASSQHSQPNLQNPSQTYPKISLQGDSRSYETDNKNKPLKNAHRWN